MIMHHPNPPVSKVLSDYRVRPTDTTKEPSMTLPLTPDQREELDDNELVRIAIESFLQLREQPGYENYDPAAMAAKIDAETGVGRTPALLAAFSKTA